MLSTWLYLFLLDSNITAFLLYIACWPVTELLLSCSIFSFYMAATWPRLGGFLSSWPHLFCAIFGRRLAVIHIQGRQALNVRAHLWHGTSSSVSGHVASTREGTRDSQVATFAQGGAVSQSTAHHPDQHHIIQDTSKNCVLREKKHRFVKKKNRQQIGKWKKDNFPTVWNKTIPSEKQVLCVGNLWGLTDSASHWLLK